MLDPTTLHFMDYAGPVIGAAVFIAVMSRAPEPLRLKLNAILAAGVVGVYLNGGFGVWELLFPLLATPVVYRGLQSYRFIGLVWLMHAAWDLPHQLWGNPIWTFQPTSSLGCMIFDTVIAIWFLFGLKQESGRTREQPQGAVAVSGA